MKLRKLKDGTDVEELLEPIELTIKTKCPQKWLLVDRETGEAYVPHSTPGKNQWKKLFNAEWSIDA
jgi:hypothetical protein